MYTWKHFFSDTPPSLSGGVCASRAYREKKLWEVFPLWWRHLPAIARAFKARRITRLRGVDIQGVVWAAKGVKIQTGACIRGPVFLGAHAFVGHGALVRGPAYIGIHAVVGHATEIVESIFFPHAWAPHFNFVGQSILGRNVNIGAGVKLANYRLDGKEVMIGKKKQETGIKKFGVILGDGVQIGCNSVLGPGTFIYPNTWVGPCQYVGSGIWKQGKNRKQIRSVV